MEGHPVPKNITDFEFHLVGDMTLKQFSYLATGLGIAYLLFVALLPSSPILAWPLIVCSSLIGVAYAFLPIADRPLDHWTSTYFKAIFHPTQRIISGNFIQDPQFLQNRLGLYLSQVSQTSQLQDQPRVTTLPTFTTSSTPSVQPQPTQTKPSPTSTSPPKITKPAQPAPKPPKSPEPVVSPSFAVKADWDLPSSQELYKTVELAKQAQIVQSKIVQTQQALNEIKTKAVTPGADPQKFSLEFQLILNNLQRLNQQASEISKQLAFLSKSTPQKPQPKIKIFPQQEKVAEKQIILTTTANIINGIVTDTQGNYLPGVIVVTHNKQGLPVRALKTNKLGQFIAATPLSNGVYTITLEKDNLAFDVLEVELDGKVLSPIRVSAKKGGI